MAMMKRENAPALLALGAVLAIAVWFLGAQRGTSEPVYAQGEVVQTL